MLTKLSLVKMNWCSLCKLKRECIRISCKCFPFSPLSWLMGEEAGHREDFCLCDKLIINRALNPWHGSNFAKGDMQFHTMTLLFFKNCEKKGTIDWGRLQEAGQRVGRGQGGRRRGRGYKSGLARGGDSLPWDSHQVAAQVRDFKCFYSNSDFQQRIISAWYLCKVCV